MLVSQRLQLSPHAQSTCWDLLSDAQPSSTTDVYELAVVSPSPNWRWDRLEIFGSVGILFWCYYRRHKSPASSPQPSVSPLMPAVKTSPSSPSRPTSTVSSPSVPALSSSHANSVNPRRVTPPRRKSLLSRRPAAVSRTLSQSPLLRVDSQRSTRAICQNQLREVHTESCALQEVMLDWPESVRREQRTQLMRPLLPRNKWHEWFMGLFYILAGCDGWMWATRAVQKNCIGVLSWIQRLLHKTNEFFNTMFCMWRWCFWLWIYFLFGCSSELSFLQAKACLNSNFRCCSTDYDFRLAISKPHRGYSSRITNWIQDASLLETENIGFRTCDSYPDFKAAGQSYIHDLLRPFFFTYRRVLHS